MGKFIILIMQHDDLSEFSFLEDLCECNTDGTAMVFNSQESASAYQEDNGIDGRVIEIPIY